MAAAEATARRATDVQVLEDAEHLIGDWHERQARRMPMLYAPTIGAALAPGIGSCGDAARPAAPRKRSTCANRVSRWPVLSVPLRRNGRRARHRRGFRYMNNGSNSLAIDLSN